VENKCCGNCVWHTPNNGEWICSCEDAGEYGMETEYGYKCEEFYER